MENIASRLVEPQFALISIHSPVQLHVTLNRLTSGGRMWQVGYNEVSLGASPHLPHFPYSPQLLLIACCQQQPLILTLMTFTDICWGVFPLASTTSTYTNLSFEVWIRASANNCYETIYSRNKMNWNNAPGKDKKQPEKPMLPILIIKLISSKLNTVYTL